MLVFENGKIKGTIGGGSLEKTVIDRVPDIILKGKPIKLSFDLGRDFQMECGGSVEVYIEPLSLPYNLYIFGAGHVGKAVARLAAGLGFSITLVDYREDVVPGDDLQGIRILRSGYLDAVESISFDRRSFVVIVTPGHESDEDVLRACIDKETAYVGMIGSKGKVGKIKEHLLKKGMDQDRIDRVDMPIGIKMKSHTPEEIAVSIAAKLIDVKNNL